MLFTTTDITGLMVIEPKVFADNRGHFFESYNEKNFIAAGIDIKFVQDNQAESVYGVVRGLHYQLNPYAQTKLVRVLLGKILDVVVDIRRGSPTYGKVFALELSAENRKQMLVPKGFAHGYSVLSETAQVLYKCDTFYSKEAEGGIIYNDAALNIDWQLPADKIILAAKDLQYPGLQDCSNNFSY